MYQEIIDFIKNFDLEVVLIGLFAFLLTYLFKLPIKKKTSTMEEDKRKMINIVIMFIPLALSFIISFFYCGFIKKAWFSWFMLDLTVTSWIYSLSMYAIVSRIYLVIKGVLSGKLKINAELSKSTIEYIKENIKLLSNENKNEKKSLSTICAKLKSLTELKALLVDDTINFDVDKISEISMEIENLKVKEATSKNKIIKNDKLISSYQKKLYLN